METKKFATVTCQTSPVITTSSTGGIKSIFPIAYKKGNEFEILPEFIPERKDEVWGYEIMPNIILAKKCGADGNAETTTWYDAKAFAEQCILNGKQGHLPSVKVLQQNWSVELRNKILEMYKFLCKNGINTETEYLGTIWCYEVYDHNNAYDFFLCNGRDDWKDKTYINVSDRLSVAF